MAATPTAGTGAGAPGFLSALFYRCNCVLRRIYGQFPHADNRYIRLLPLALLIVLLTGGGGLRRAGPAGLRGGALKLGTTPPSARELAKVNARLSKMDADEILIWAHETFPDGGLVDVSSFGPSGMVILHKMQGLGILKDVPVLTIDTLHLFPETYKFSQGLKDELDGMDLRVFRPHGYDDKAAFDDAYGSDLWKTNPDKYGYLSKVEPTLRALDELSASAWMTGRRRSQGGERAELDVLEIDKADNNEPKRFKVNPLAYWSYDDVWGYIKEHDVPYNPLHDKGYKSIGDYMTTAPVDDLAAERSGRFVGLGTTECGIHATRKKIKRMREQAEADGREFDQAALPCPSCKDVEPSTFVDIVLRGSTDMLIEFYSPMCGGCQEFAPKMKKIAKTLKRDGKAEVARFDITEHDVPKSGQDKGLVVEGTPTLYFIRRNPKFEVILYEGDHETTPIMDWINTLTQ